MSCLYSDKHRHWDNQKVDSDNSLYTSSQWSDSRAVSLKSKGSSILAPAVCRVKLK